MKIAANLRIQPKEEASLKGVLREMIKACGEGPSRYLKVEIGPAMDMVTPEDEASICEREIWDMLKGDLAGDLIASPEAQLNVKSTLQNGAYNARDPRIALVTLLRELLNELKSK